MALINQNILGGSVSLNAVDPLMIPSYVPSIEVIRNVVITAPQDAQFLGYDSATQTWRNKFVLSDVSISTLKDVTVTSPVNGQSLVFNNGHWVNTNVSGGSGSGSSTLLGLTDVNITSPVGGQTLTFDAVSNLWKNMTASGGSNIINLDAIPDVTVLSPVNGNVLTYLNGTWVNAEPQFGSGGSSGSTLNVGTTTTVVGGATSNATDPTTQQPIIIAVGSTLTVTGGTVNYSDATYDYIITGGVTTIVGGSTVLGTDGTVLSTTGTVSYTGTRTQTLRNTAPTGTVGLTYPVSVVTGSTGNVLHFTGTGVTDAQGDAIHYKIVATGTNYTFSTTDNIVVPAQGIDVTFSAPTVVADTLITFNVYPVDVKGAVGNGTPVSITTTASTTVNHAPDATTVTVTAPSTVVTGSNTNSLTLSGGTDPDGNTVYYKIVSTGSPQFTFNTPNVNQIPAGTITFTAPSGVLTNTTLSFNVYAVDSLGAVSTTSKSVSVIVTPVGVDTSATGVIDQPVLTVIPSNLSVDALLTGVDGGTLYNGIESLDFSPDVNGAVWGSVIFPSGWSITDTISVNGGYALDGNNAGTTVRLRLEVWTLEENQALNVSAEATYQDDISFTVGASTYLTEQLISNVATNLFVSTTKQMVFKLTRLAEDAGDTYQGVFKLVHLTIRNENQVTAFNAAAANHVVSAEEISVSELSLDSLYSGVETGTVFGTYLQSLDFNSDFPGSVWGYLPVTGQYQSSDNIRIESLAGLNVTDSNQIKLKLDVWAVKSSQAVNMGSPDYSNVVTVGGASAGVLKRDLLGTISGLFTNTVGLAIRLTRLADDVGDTYTGLYQLIKLVVTTVNTTSNFHIGYNNASIEMPARTLDFNPGLMVAESSQVFNAVETISLLQTAEVWGLVSIPMSYSLIDAIGLKAELVLDGIDVGKTVSLKIDVWGVNGWNVPNVNATADYTNTINVTTTSGNVGVLTTQVLGSIPSILLSATGLLMRLTRLNTDNYNGLVHLSRFVLEQPTAVGGGTVNRDLIGGFTSTVENFATSPVWEKVVDDTTIFANQRILVYADKDVVLTVDDSTAVTGDTLEIVNVTGVGIVTVIGTIDGQSTKDYTTRKISLFYIDNIVGWITL